MDCAVDRVFLVGPRASGKTTVGRALAERLGFAFLDLDQAIIEAAGKTVAEIVAHAGWPGFRALEKAALEKALTEKKLVCATGGGVVIDPQSRRLLKERTTGVYLKADPELCVARLTVDPLEAQRPTLTGKPLAEEVKTVVAERDPWYKQSVQLVVDAGLPVSEIVETITKTLERFR